MAITHEWMGPEAATRGGLRTVRNATHRPRSGVRIPDGKGSGASACNQLLPLVLGKPAPDAVGLVDLQSVAPALQKRGAPRANRLGFRFPSCSGRSAFAFGVEEIRAGHASACGMELPIPQVGIRSRKTPGIGHCSSPFDLVFPGSDSAGIADELTIDRAATMIKTVATVVLLTHHEPVSIRRESGLV